MVEYTTLNVATFLLGLFFIYSGYRMVKRGREDLALFLMSGTVGVGLIVVAVYPDIFELVATLIGLELKARAILVISNLTLFVIITYLFNRISQLYGKVSGLNEELSLLRATVEEQQMDRVDESTDQNDD